MTFMLKHEWQDKTVPEVSLMHTSIYKQGMGPVQVGLLNSAYFGKMSRPT